MKINAAFVPYKDFNDEDHLAPHTIVDFTDDMTEYNNRLKNLYHSGGGD